MPDDGLPIGSDADLHTASDSLLADVSGDQIGAGRELDEAELADTEPVVRAESLRLQEMAARHARDARYFEPAEAEMQRQKRVDEQTAAAASEDDAEPDAQITIHLSAHRHRSLTLQTEKREAEVAYDRHIAAYLDYLREEAAAAGYGLLISKGQSEEAITYQGSATEREAAHDWLHTLPDFWNWIP